ncbi:MULTISPECIES: Tn3 family transposase [Actinoalloteichus]|uniref:Transposase, TnpA family n=1 Tax=Actinoalloteichus fjordicus TaxID=1612552 RepID=A0AAC9LCJ4_9PSEU|nr:MULTISPECIES: Tn3 family transposase [Actinoalloteichus]APU15087.1 transposase, TnpA family [Actinoalloteichus fjordicus]APU21156.1 transposase, TnpA family [Actinoalloteichus sp. GBA129-24]
MPVEFLSDDQASAYGRFPSGFTRAELERYFFLDDVDLALIESKRRDHNRLGFAVQLATVRYAGGFLDDPLDGVPVELVDYLAEQLGIADPSCVKSYGDREMTRLDHAREIREADGWYEFGGFAGELGDWVEGRAWTTGDGPKALFDAAVGWLRDRRALLPGVSTLVRLVAGRRDAATGRLWDTLFVLLTDEQKALLDRLLEVADGERLSALDKLRRPPTRVSGPAMIGALERAAEILGLGFGGVDASVVPPRRLAELSRYGMEGKATLLRRHPDSRRLATLLATVVYLQTRAVDDALDLLDVLITSKLLARAERESNKLKVKTWPKLGKASIRLAAVVGVLMEITGAGEDLAADAGREDVAFEPVSLAQVWEQIEAVVPREQITKALTDIVALAGPADEDADAAWRAELVKRYATVRPFLPLLCQVIAFGAAPDGERVLRALTALPGLWGGGRNKVGVEEIDQALLIGSWRKLVLSGPELEPGAVDWRAYTFCVLEQFHRHLKRRDIFAVNSSKWGDPRAKLLAGDAWSAAKPLVLASLELPEDPAEHLAERARLLHDTYLDVASRLPGNAAVSFDDDGRLHLKALLAEADPPSLVDLREFTHRMLPRVDLPEVLLEVFSWTGADAAFTSITGGEARLSELNVTIAALLVAEACNIGWRPVTKPGVAALTRDRLAHVNANYLRLDTIRAANAALIDAQAAIGLAGLWGGGHVASVDGMRFVVPVNTVHAGYNPKYFKARKGATWLNMVNDQAAGLGAKVVAGTPRDSLYVLDVLYDRDGGVRPQTIVTDTASYSDIVFGLLSLAGWTYAPQLADLPDQKLWRVDTRADYGPFNTAARGRVDLERIARHWEDILRVIASIHTGAVRAHDVIRMLSRDGNPTPLGEAIAHYGRIHKSLHVLRMADEPDYRRTMKSQGNLQEGRHALGRDIFHGKRGELRQRYYEGMEDQLGALGLVLNALVLFNTRYLDAAITHLREGGHEVRDEDATRLSPFRHRHINLLGRYSFLLPADLAGGLRPLRDPNALAEESDEDDPE